MGEGCARPAAGAAAAALRQDWFPTCPTHPHHCCCCLSRDEDSPAESAQKDRLLQIYNRRLGGCRGGARG